jgi:GT2 family glycosyltransferase
MISIICVYNDEWILQNYLLKSLPAGRNDFELITFDNTHNRFRSAAQALNWCGRQAVGDYLMFVHQDVDLRSDSWLNSTEALLNSLPNLGIAGVVGGRNHKSVSFRELCTTMFTDRPSTRFRGGISWGPRNELCGIPIQDPEPVQTLDECLVIIPKSVFDVTQFDETTCCDWHLYAVDYCLSIAEQGFGVYVIPSCLYHRSGGYSDENPLRIIASLGVYPEAYYRSLERVLRKHKRHYKWIHTTCGSWNTTHPLVIQRAVILLSDGCRFYWRRVRSKTRRARPFGSKKE